MYAKFEKTVYISKILACAMIIMLIAISFDNNRSTNLFLWSSLTAFFTIQFGHKNKVNFNQISGNMIGATVGIIIWLLMHHFIHHAIDLHLEYWFLVLGILLTTLICIISEHAEYCGIALSSFLIVTVYDINFHTIEGALFRILYCVIGCLTAYIVDLLSRKMIQLFFPKYRDLTNTQNPTHKKF